MKKKMKDKQRSRHDESSKFEYLPLSPPPLQRKPTQDTHYQSSSSPVGRPPPLDVDNQDLHESDIRVLEDLKNFLAASTSSVDQNEEYHNQNLLPPFIEDEQLDVHLYDDDNNSIMSFEEGDMDFFPSLPDKS